MANRLLVRGKSGDRLDSAEVVLPDFGCLLKTPFDVPRYRLTAVAPRNTERTRSTSGSSLSVRNNVTANR